MTVKQIVIIFLVSFFSYGSSLAKDTIRFSDDGVTFTPPPPPLLKHDQKLLVHSPASEGYSSQNVNGKLLNLDFDGKAGVRRKSPFEGALAYGKDGDMWNSAGHSAWPLTDIALDNEREALIWSDGKDVEGDPVLRVQGLGQYWDAFASGPSTFGLHLLAFENWIYSDLPGPGVVSLKRLPPGKYDVFVYSPPTIPSFQTSYQVEVRDKSKTKVIETLKQPTSGNNDEQLLTQWKEGVQYVAFRGLRVQKDEELALIVTQGKKHLSAVQILKTP